MALTPSNMLELGIQAPNFELPDFSGKLFSFENCKGSKGTLVIFMCNHCPYVIHVLDVLTEMANAYKREGIGVVAISSNDIENYPDDRPELMELLSNDYGFEFPYLYDESQEVAKAYDAACTPDFYVFDLDSTLVYRGRMDESRPSSGIPVTGKDLERALDAVIQNLPQEEDQRPSMGCNIKWKK